MQPEDYAKTWREILNEKSDLYALRTNLENELIEVKNKISHLDEVLVHLAPLAGLPYANEEEISQLGLTDAIRSILKRSGSQVSARDVRDELSVRGYDLDGLSAPMASIYKILSRLVENGEIDRFKDADTAKVLFQWKGSQITDDDIPF